MPHLPQKLKEGPKGQRKHEGGRMPTCNSQLLLFACARTGELREMEMHMTGKSVRVREQLTYIRKGDSRRPGAQLYIVVYIVYIVVYIVYIYVYIVVYNTTLEKKQLFKLALLELRGKRRERGIGCSRVK